MKESERFISSKFKPFGEVYASMTINKLADIIKDNDKIKTLNLKLSNKVNALKQAGALPYILLSITEEGGGSIESPIASVCTKIYF